MKGIYARLRMRIIVGFFKRFFLNPLTRISFGLVMLTVSLLLVCDMLGLFPDVRQAELEYRKSIAESIAVQVALNLESRNTDNLDRLLTSMVKSNQSLLSATVRSVSGSVFGLTEYHTDNWTLRPDERSTPEQIVVELFSSQGDFGRLQLIFTPFDTTQLWFRGGQSIAWIILYVALAGFVGYFFFMRKVLKELDPGNVMPDRVRYALDSLTEGLVILDDSETVLFANHSFSSQLGVGSNDLVGKSVGSLEWDVPREGVENPVLSLPWTTALSGSRVARDVLVDLAAGGRTFRFSVNCSLIEGSADRVRGVLVTFADVTEVDQRRQQLENALSSLRESQEAISRKNDELFMLATRDFLTNVLNRRAFLEAFEEQFTQAKQQTLALGVIMVDLDKFKNVNDTYGHSVGDEVITYTASVLQSHALGNDLVARFGGEEFCMVTVDTDREQAIERAEQIRLTIEQGIGANFDVDLSLTASLGVAVLPSDADTPKVLIDRADKALYHSKNTGRNRVSQWGDAGVCDVLSSSLPGEMETDVPVLRDSGKMSSLPGPSEDNEAIDVEHDAEFSDGPSRVVDTVPIELRDARKASLLHSIHRVLDRNKTANFVAALLVIDSDTLRELAGLLGDRVATSLCTLLVDRLQRSIRPGDLVDTAKTNASSPSEAGAVAQTESNAIVLVLGGIENVSLIAAIVHRILDCCKQPLSFEGSTYHLEVNIGVAIHGVDGHTSEQLLQNASLAMHQLSRKQHVNDYCFFSPTIDDAAKREFKLRNDLQSAVERRELSLRYQPKVSLETGKIVGLEALLRWRHAELGHISPAEFIPLAEKSDLIVSLNSWMMNNVADQMAFLRENGLSTVPVAINLSSSELKDETLEHRLVEILNTRNLNPQDFEIEITESESIDALADARKLLRSLHNRGFKIAVDDFGTGYASLNYLQQFPIDRLKIDKAFVDGIELDARKRQLIKSIIALGNILKVTVLAEGVETLEQLKLLREFHCQEVQGYYLSKPIEINALGTLLRDQSEIHQKVMMLSIDNHYPGVSGKPVISDQRSASERASDSDSGFSAIVNPFPREAVNDPDHHTNLKVS